MRKGVKCYNRPMKRVLVGTLIFGFVLAFFSPRSNPACLITGFLATLVLLQLGPRSIAEKVGVLLAASAMAWLGGPVAPGRGSSLLEHLAGWALASTALAAYLHPRAD